MGQTTIFDMLYPKKKITKPIRLIELFSGYGSQALALKYLGVPFEHWKICEWAVKSIQAYKDIHFANESVNLDLLMDKKQMVDFLYNKGISSNYNDPMTKQQIERLSEEQLEKIIKNIFIIHNLVNIQKVKGEDLEIVDTDKYEYILTYSFPCQDLSLAGKGRGMSDTSTRSGMLWEVERILTECYYLGEMPQILLMENVPQVHSEDNLPDFNKWKYRLEELGYKNYFQDLIATDYGIPQTRNRCFMISLLGDYSYTFPKPIPLKLKLKDMLENNVDEKYYLSDSMNKSLIHTLEQNKINDNCYIDTYNKRIDKDKSGTITTGVSFRNNTFLAIKKETSKAIRETIEMYDNLKPNQFIDAYNRKIKDDNNAGTIATRVDLQGVCDNNLRIRKLTPKECFRLMGVKDEDFDKVKINQSDSSLYHLAGDSIVVNVLMAIFNELLKKEGE